MACGLGAVALMFIFVKEATFSPLSESFKNEILPLEDQIVNIESLIQSKTTELSNIKQTIDNTNIQINTVKLKTDVTNTVIDSLVNQNTDLASSLQKIESMPKEKYNVKKSYISGCNVEGKRIILLLDSSKSMLHKELVEIFRLSVQTDKVKQNTEKWTKGKDIFRWLFNNLPDNSQVFLASFNEDLNLYQNDRTWIDSKNTVEIEKRILYLTSNVPDNGTNLQQAVKKLPLKDADNIYLITDGLPTLAIQPNTLRENIQSRSVTSSLSLKEERIQRCLNKSLVDLDCRLNFFNAFKETFQSEFRNTKLNTILLPMKGDPEATYEFSLLSKQSGGCFLTSSKDWP
tara:strand:- start:1043 stop:2077 length:1035 start_codon:yes stop_codon:yes gene_type:complete